jgi:peptide/nickel transport system permease protein
MITTAARPRLSIPELPVQPRLWRFVKRNPTLIGGALLFGLMLLMAVGAPYWGTLDPLELNPIERLRAPSPLHWFGADMLGRDLYSRTIYGSRISLCVGGSVAILSVGLGLSLGLLSGYHRRVDAIVMRIMDGVMAIPAILLAIALMALVSASVQNVVIALTIPEIPRVVRVVRAVVLSLREQAYIEASRATGANVFRILGHHILPNTIAPLLVQGTYICASAVILEAYLSFLGAGTPPEIASWGNIMAEGRAYVRIAFWILLFPGLCLATTVLAINLMGDGLRDTLDPKLARRL